MEAIRELLKPELIWFLVGLLLILGEFLMPGLVIIFFGVGAWVVAAICMMSDISLNTQLLIFIVTSIISLLALRRFVKGIFMGHTSDTQELTESLEDFLGKHVVVQEAIANHQQGKVELNGSTWTATADQDIPVGQTVKIIGKDNLTLKVKAL